MELLSGFIIELGYLRKLFILIYIITIAYPIAYFWIKILLEGFASKVKNKPCYLYYCNISGFGK